MKHDDPLRERDLKVERSIQRAFDGAVELDPRSDDDARIDAAIARTLDARSAKIEGSPFARVRLAVYLAAAALAAGALAYAAAHQQGEGAASAAVESRADVEAPAETPGALESPAAVETPAAAESPAAVPSTVEPPPATASSTPPATASSTPPSISVDALPSMAPQPRASAAPPSSSPQAPAPRGNGPAPPDHATPELAPALGPAELFARANDARRGGETKQAIALYEELQSRFPDSREASTSRVAHGRLLLDRAGEPERARALFDRYLARDPSGPLAEEARVGRAVAFMRLGDASEERAAWRDVLQRHPESAHAERARQRLAALGN